MPAADPCRSHALEPAFGTHRACNQLFGGSGYCEWVLTVVGYAPMVLALVVGFAHKEASHDCGGAEADHVAPVPGASDGQGISSRAHAAYDGPEGHRDPVPGDVVRLLSDRRHDGAADSRRAGRPGAAVPEQRAVQPAVHDARHDHAAALRDTDPVRLRELHRAAADRRTGRRLPAVERLLLLAVPVRRIDRAVQLCHAGRHVGAHVYDPANGGAILWQHLFWFFGHPEVYIVALPFFGIVTEVFPVFARKPLFGYKGMVFATIAIGALSAAVWAHHMYATGAVLLAFFSLTTFLIAVPTGVKFVNWIGTIWQGKITYETPMMFALGFLVTFLFGGLTGILLASPPLDFHVSDTYFVVAHFHYVLFGTIVFATYSGIYFWFPKMTGRMMDETLGKIHFWTTFFGFHMTFLVQHWLGNEGMPRRYADYLPTDGFTVLNAISSIGAFVLGASTLPFLYNVWKSYKLGRTTTADDPWGFGNSLEWATSCPPPRHNFTELPRIRSERPAFELHYPEYVERYRNEAHVGGHSSPYEVAAQGASKETQPNDDPRSR